MLDDGSILRVMQWARDCGALVCMHAENGEVIDALVAQARARGDTAPRFHALTRPPRCEGEATGRALDLAAIAGAPIYIVHVTCREAVDRIAQARRRGQAAFGETCPQYLFLSQADYDRPGFEGAKFVMSPPLRDAANQEVLWGALRADVLQVVGTDHCPFGFEHPPLKQRGRHDFSAIPNGGPGIEHRLMLVWDGGVRTGRISPNRFVELTAANPARLFGLWPRKGTIAVGSDGDLVVWDPAKRVTISAATHHMRVDHNLYEGRLVTGAPAVVLSRGEVIVRDDEFLGRAGRGQYLKRQAAATVAG
jgi:dihydropyrimidinase